MASYNIITALYVQAEHQIDRKYQYYGKISVYDVYYAFLAVELVNMFLTSYLALTTAIS